MIKVRVAAVGRLKEKYFADAVSEYAKRLSAYCRFEVVEVPAAPPSKSPAEQSAEEGRGLLAAARGFIVALDGGGEKLHGEFTFLIGGSHGLSPEVKAAADKTLSFGDMTFPHQLFRVMLAEQIYRAFCIIAGTPYHK